MKLNDIIILEKSTQPIIGYHVTNGNHLRSIIKQGLIPNKEKGGYGYGDKGNMNTSLDSLPGVYFSISGRNAEYLSKDIGGRSPIIIIANLQYNNLESDEDNITGDLVDSFALKRAINKDLDNENFDIESFAHKWTDYIISRKLTDLDQRGQSSIEPLLFDYILKVIYFYLGKTDNEILLRQALNKVTVATRKMINNNNYSHETFKINKPINFSGSNRIIGIYNVTENVGWGDLKYFEKSAYHKVKNPIDLLKYTNNSSVNIRNNQSINHRYNSSVNIRNIPSV